MCVGGGGLLLLVLGRFCCGGGGGGISSNFGVVQLCVGKFIINCSFGVAGGPKTLLGGWSLPTLLQVQSTLLILSTTDHCRWNNLLLFVFIRILS